MRRWWRMRYPAYLAGLVVGLALIWPAYGSYQAREARATQLRTTGVPVQAQVAQVLRSERLRLWYMHDGVERSAEISCWQACHPVGAPVQIWINPNEPDDFVTSYGTLSKQKSDLRFLIAVVGVWVSAAALISSVDGAARYLRGRRRQRGKIPAQPAQPAEPAETAP